MPAVTKGKILVTGANGFIAAWVIKSLLEAGYLVCGTVRRQSAIAHLQDTFKKYADRFEVVIVEDITQDGAFDESVKGVDAIVHTASPCHWNPISPDEVIGPAISGTQSILFSALKHANNTVKRIVITSSTAAIINSKNLPRILTEADWNEESIEEVKGKVKDLSPVTVYRASKTLAEKAAWEFMEEHKHEVNFDLVALNPAFVYGPVLHDVRTPENLNASMLDWYNAVIKGTNTNEELVTIKSAWVDVQDTGLAHTLALQKEDAGGQRIILVSGAWIWQNFVDAAHAIDSSLPAGNTSHDISSTVFPVLYNNTRSKEVLGLTYKSVDVCTKSILEQFNSRGWC